MFKRTWPSLSSALPLARWRFRRFRPSQWTQIARLHNEPCSNSHHILVRIAQSFYSRISETHQRLYSGLRGLSALDLFDEWCSHWTGEWQLYRPWISSRRDCLTRRASSQSRAATDTQQCWSYESQVRAWSRSRILCDLSRPVQSC